MNPSQRQFDYVSRWRPGTAAPLRGREITVDLFCGGGGASTGIEAAIGRPVDVAINHSEDAIFYHEKNHPATDHYKTDVFDVHPMTATKGRPVGLLWLSPDCTHFAKARGSKPKSKNIRSLATVGLWWAKTVRPRIICLENVEEFQTWCRLDKRNMQPDFRKKGEYFQKFVRRLRQEGYVVEWQVRRACDRGTPTIRKRLFLVARCDGELIRWTKETHGPGRKHPYRTAAECIDFTIPTVSIFATKEECKAAGIRAVRPLADNTMQRVARGVWKYVINNPEPFIVPAGAPFITECANGSNQRNMAADEPLRTVCAQVKGGHFALVNALLEKHVPENLAAYHIERMGGQNRGESVDAPLSSITAQVNKHALVTTHIERMQGTSTGEPMDVPLSGISAQGQHHALVTSHLMKYHTQQNGEDRCHSLNEPLPTVDGSNRFAEVRAFLIKYYGNGVGQVLDEPLGTVTGNDRFGLVVVKGELWRIVDIGLRMLTPDELLRAQFGRFAAEYNLDGLTKTKAVKMIGNSVCPEEAFDVVKANYKPLVWKQEVSVSAPDGEQLEMGGVAA